MPVQLYETMFILDSSKLASDPDGVKGHLHSSLEKHGGTIEVSRTWDDRKLAYPINKQKKGSYHIIYYRMESRNQGELERDFKLNEDLLRHMTLMVDPKWADAVLDVARNDTAPAFAIRGLQEEGGAGDGTPSLNMAEGLPEGEAVAAARGGRRGRRDSMAEKPE